MNIKHVPKKTPVSPDIPSFGVEFEFLIAVLAKPSIENPTPPIHEPSISPPPPKITHHPTFKSPSEKKTGPTNGPSTHTSNAVSLPSVSPPNPEKPIPTLPWPPPPSRRNKKSLRRLASLHLLAYRNPHSAYYYNEDALRDISDFCAIMRKNYLVTVNESCGLHVHIGYGTQGFTLPHLRRLGAIIEAFEPQFDSIHPEHRIDSRNAHCVSFRQNTYFQYQYRQDHGRAPRVLETIATLLACESRDAFRTCVASEATTGSYAFVGETTAWNFDRMGTESKRRPEHVPDTIEFRGHEGSLDAEAVGNWVRTLVGVVEYTRSVNAWGFGELLLRAREESWELGARDQRVTGQGRYEPGGVMYRPVFGEEWCGLVDLLRVLKINGPALYYESRKGRWLENGVYNHWYKHAPSEYVVQPIHEDPEPSNDDESLPPSSKPSSGSETGLFDPFNPNPIPVTPGNPVEKPEGEKTTPVDLTSFDIDTGFSDHSSSPTKKVSAPKPSVKPYIAVPYPDTPETKPKPTPRTGFKVPSSSSSSSTTNSSTKSVSLTSSHYEREAVKARAIAAKFWDGERKREKDEAEKEKSSMDLGSVRAMSTRSAASASAVEFTDTGAREEEDVWEPQGWKGADSDAISEETRVFAEAKRLSEEQAELEERIRNLRPGIGYLHAVRHPPLHPLPGPVKYTHRAQINTRISFKVLLQLKSKTSPPTPQISSAVPSTAHSAHPPPLARTRPIRKRHESPPNALPGPVPIIEESRITMLEDALNSTIGEEWIWDHGLRTRSAGLQHMLRGRQLYEVSPTIKARLLAYNDLIINHHSHGRSIHQLFPARAHNVTQFEAADDRWWRGQIAESEIVRLERQAADSDENAALNALETLDSMRRGEQYFYQPVGVQNPFASGPRTQAQIQEDISPGADAPIAVPGPDTSTSASSAVPAGPRNPRTEERNHFRKVQEDACRATRELEEAEEAAAKDEMEKYEAEMKRRMEVAMAMILKAREEAAATEEEDEEENGDKEEEEDDEEEEEKDSTIVAPEPQDSWEKDDEGGFGTV
ncbi:hypothetical protein H4I96_11003 [Botrytis cinerea]